MMVLFYFNWAGTEDEFKQFADRIKSSVAEGVSFVGLFIPTSEWNFVVVWNTKTYEAVLQTINQYVDKYGSLKMSLAKAEVLHTFEELRAAF